MRLKPVIAVWVKGYESKPLFDNTPHVRKPVVSLFAMPQTAGRLAYGAARGGKNSSFDKGGDNV